jgi:hemerythrin
VRKYIAWQDGFSVGVQVIDEQHKMLLQVINEFLSSLEGSGDHFAIARSLNDMIKYTEYHFYAEQLLLEKHPDFLAHLNQHWQLVKQAKKMQEDFQQYRDLKADIFDFLLSWLKDHILGTDKVYFSYLINNNLL